MRQTRSTKCFEKTEENEMILIWVADGLNVLNSINRTILFFK